MSNINPQTGEKIPGGGASPRFVQWAAFFVFSIITLGSSVEVRNGLAEDASSAATYAVVCSAVSFVILALVFCAHLVPVCNTCFIGTVFEGILCIILNALWAATVAIVADASNGLGVVTNENQEERLNGNLYYFSWAGFVTSVILTVSYLRGVFGVDLVGTVANRGTRLTLWGAFLASSVVVMGASIRIHVDSCSDASMVSAFEITYCRRANFSIAVGTISVAFALMVVAAKILCSLAPFIFEFGFSAILTILNAFCVAFVTSAKGPGATIGNLYYFSWIAFLCSGFLTADCFKQFISGNAGGSGSGGDNTDKNDANGEIEVETVLNL